MPPRGVKSAKRRRQYEYIKKSVSARGRSNKVAERIAAATTNMTRREKGVARIAGRDLRFHVARFDLARSRGDPDAAARNFGGFGPRRRPRPPHLTRGVATD